MESPRSRPNVGGEATRAALVDAAERLFAERGIEGVSLREIGVAAGKRNTNVTQYHFGDRDSLIRAIVSTRAARLGRLRIELLAESDGTPNGLARALVEPLAAELDGESHYLGFLFQLLVSRDGRLPLTPDLDPEATASFREVVRRLRTELPGIPTAVLRTRAELATGFTIVALAMRSKAEQRGEPGLLGRPEFTAEVVRAVGGILGTIANS
ncbi:MAG: TetR/AcrR family transcriptional regulator [Acidimicrobiales bacterium]